MHARFGLGRIGARRSRAPRLIYLVAPAGHPNFGDELIARTWLEHLAGAYPDDEVVLDCHTPGQAALLLRGAHPRVTFTDTLWRIMMLADEHGRPSPLWEWSAHAATTVGAEPRIDTGIGLLQCADVIHLLGGGYVNAVWPHHVALVTAAAAVAERFGARAVATGQGVMPVPEGGAAAALASAARSFAVFDTRDRESYRVLADAPGASMTGDDAWLAVAGSRRWAHHTSDGGDAAGVQGGVGQGGVVLCLQSDLAGRFTRGGRAGPDALADWAARVLDDWGVAGSEITAVEGIPGEDRIVFDLLGDRVAGARFVPFAEAWRSGLPLDAGQTWISTRFHPHLLAAAAGVSGVAVATEPGYYGVKHRSLTEAGSRWAVVSGGEEVPPRPADGGFDASGRRAAVDCKAGLAEGLHRTA